jgi:hypothetical protein
MLEREEEEGVVVEEEVVRPLGDILKGNSSWDVGQEDFWLSAGFINY